MPLSPSGQRPGGPWRGRQNGRPGRASGLLELVEEDGEAYGRGDSAPIESGAVARDGRTVRLGQSRGGDGGRARGKRAHDRSISATLLDHGDRSRGRVQNRYCTVRRWRTGLRGAFAIALRWASPRRREPTASTGCWIGSDSRSSLRQFTPRGRSGSHGDGQEARHRPAQLGAAHRLRRGHSVGRAAGSRRSRAGSGPFGSLPKVPATPTQLERRQRLHDPGYWF